ncbi:capsid protein [Burkholderia multivorans]|uniref:capsid protein n=1 Tax=Burkholderia multivorans TaxID=87883 RepID=UPI001C27AAEB|nr:capsid protein [Burkholderia multivorans]MBU9376297.1 capsid protein [Burkholderia multivorans]MDN7597233.1 capsid protein [Burkholderia multivorans]MDN7844502.1 capsid protein [Burkholderia multivorans]
MGISIANVSRPMAQLQTGNNTQVGQAPAATNPLALVIEEYGGVVEHTIARRSIVRNFVPIRTVKGTSTVTNYQVGKSTLSKVTPGTAPDATVNGSQKVKLTIDTLVNARAVVPLLDDFQSSYDARAAIGMEHGIEIAKFFDQSFFIQAVKAAQISDMTQYPAGWQPGSVTSFAATGDELDPVKLEAKFLDLFAQMADKDVDPHDDGLVIVTKPKYFYTLLQNQRLVDRELITSDGTKITTKALAVAGVPIYFSNNLPTTNITGHFLSNAGNDNAYDGDFTKTVAAVFSPRALLAGETIPLTPDVFYDPITKMWFIDAHLSFGVTPNNPAFAGLLKAA